MNQDADWQMHTANTQEGMSPQDVMDYMLAENAALRAEVARLTAENEKLASESDGWRYGHEYQKKIAELATKQLTETRSKSAVFECLASDYYELIAIKDEELAAKDAELKAIQADVERLREAANEADGTIAAFVHGRKSPYRHDNVLQKLRDALQPGFISRSDP